MGLCLYLRGRRGLILITAKINAPENCLISEVHMCYNSRMLSSRLTEYGKQLRVHVLQFVGAQEYKNHVQQHTIPTYLYDSLFTCSYHYAAVNNDTIMPSSTLYQHIYTLACLLAHTTTRLSTMILSLSVLNMAGYYLR